MDVPVFCFPSHFSTLEFSRLSVSFRLHRIYPEDKRPKTICRAFIKDVYLRNIMADPCRKRKRKVTNDPWKAEMCAQVCAGGDAGRRLAWWRRAMSERLAFLFSGPGFCGVGIRLT